mmetsp:Transcript_117572/g.332617  ORF Transcript_117572/g.332617 Transcript_117572/m.332617 type:complete len:314 (+) Transcript_117572:33-974(+)
MFSEHCASKLPGAGCPSVVGVERCNAKARSASFGPDSECCKLMETALACMGADCFAEFAAAAMMLEDNRHALVAAIADEDFAATKGGTGVVMSWAALCTNVAFPLDAIQLNINRTRDAMLAASRIEEVAQHYLPNFIHAGAAPQPLARTDLRGTKGRGGGEVRPKATGSASQSKDGSGFFYYYYDDGDPAGRGGKGSVGDGQDSDGDGSGEEEDDDNEDYEDYKAETPWPDQLHRHAAKRSRLNFVGLETFVAAGALVLLLSLSLITFCVRSRSGSCIASICGIGRARIVRAMQPPDEPLMPRASGDDRYQQI